jgi:hypothetical protein
MTARSEYVLEPIRKGPDFTLYRGRLCGDQTTKRRSWPSHYPLNNLGVPGDWSTNTRSQPSSIPRGQLSLWRSLVTKG